VFLVGLLIGAQASDGQGLSSSDLSRLRSVGNVELSPTAGHRIAYSVTMRDRPAAWVSSGPSGDNSTLPTERKRERSLLLRPWPSLACAPMS